MRDQYVDALKQTAIDMGTKLVVQLLLKKIPGFFSPLLTLVVGHILKLAIKHTEMGAFFLFIDTRVNKQGQDFAKRALANREVQINGTPEQKARAEKELMDSFRAFVMFTN